MEKAEAQALLTAAAANYKAATTRAERSRDQLQDVVRQVAKPGPLRQVDIVKTTGWTREYVRRLVKPRKSIANTQED